MALLQRGKTKDVYSHGDYTLELKFTDRVTLNDQGEVDPGGNNVSDSLATGQGFACLSMTTTIFSYLAANGIPTHMVSYDLDNLSMVVRKAVTFKPGLEWPLEGYRQFHSPLQNCTGCERRYGLFLSGL